MRRWILWAATCAVLMTVSTATPALAQPEAPAAFREEHKDKPDEVLTFTASLGLVYASGNTNSWTLNGGTQFRLVRGRSAFSLDWTLAYGRADLTPLDDTRDFQDTVRNSNARARYDFYLTRMDALFVAIAHRWDTFAGLDTRLQAQIGYLRNFVQRDKLRLWGEVGYDFTYDNLDPDPLVDEMGMELDGTQNVHAARAYLGYDNKLNELLNVSMGVEALFNLQQGEDIRLNLDAALVSSLSDLFKVEVKFKLLFDNVPVQGDPPRAKVDTLLTVNLVFSWEQEQEPEEPAAEEAPAEEPAAEEAPAEEPAAEEAPAEEPAEEAPAEEPAEETEEDTDEQPTEEAAAEGDGV